MLHHPPKKELLQYWYYYINDKLPSLYRIKNNKSLAKIFQPLIKQGYLKKTKMHLGRQYEVIFYERTGK